MRAALTFSESNLLEFVEFAPPAAQLAAEIARSLEPVLGVLRKPIFIENYQFPQELRNQMPMLVQLNF